MMQERSALQTQLFLHLLAFIATALPVWAVSILPLVDYTNHLARMELLHRYAESAELQQNYVVEWHLVPYFAMEAVVLPLLHITDVYTAGKIFVLLAFLLTTVGVLGLQFIAYRRLSAATFLVYPALYSVNLGWGFVPFVFSIGLMLCLLCGVLLTREASYWVRLAYLSVACTALFLSHLVALGIFGLLIACVVTARSPWFSRDFFYQGLSVTPCFLPSLALWTQVPAFPGGASTTEGWLNPVKLVPMAFNADYTMALLAMLPIAVVLYVGWRERLVDVSSPEIWRLLLVTGGVALIVPERLFNVGLVGLRLPYVWILLLAAGAHVKPGSFRSKGVVALFAAVAALYIARHGMVAASLQRCDAKLVEFREATHHLPKGTRLTAVYDITATDPCGNTHWPEHANTLAVIERDAFVPNFFFRLFAVLPAPQLDDPAYDVILPAEIHAFFPGSPGYEKTPLKMREWRENFDYIAYFHGTPSEPIPDTTLVHEGSWFTLLQIVPSPSSTPR